VLGIDLVAGFLAIAAEEAAKRGVQVGWAQGDLREFTADAVFDGAVCLFDVFGFFTDEGDERILRNVLGALVPGGHFLLDLRPREVLARMPPVAVVDKGNGDLMIDRHHFDVETGRLVDRRTTVRRGLVREVAFSVRLYTLTEMRSILQRIGFELAGVYGGYDGSPPTVASSRLLMLARKPS